jgi:hypothetical protein
MDLTHEIREDPTRVPPFKAYEFISQWEPAENAVDGIPAGFSILIGEPNGSIRPLGFVEGSCAALEAVVNEVRSQWGSMGNLYVQQWEEFLNEAPSSDDVLVFVKERGLHIPLEKDLFDGKPIDLSSIVQISYFHIILSKTYKRNLSVMHARQPSTRNRKHVVGIKKANPSVQHRFNRKDIPYATVIEGEPDEFSRVPKPKRVGKKQSNISSLDVPGNVDGGSDDGLLEVDEMASNIKRMKLCGNKRSKRQRHKITSSSSVTDTPSMTVLSDNLEETALTGAEGHRLVSWSAKYVCCALCLHTLFNNLIFRLGIPKKYSVKEKKKSDEKSGESDDGSKCSWSGTDSDGDVDSSDNVCINKCLIVSYDLLYKD